MHYYVAASLGGKWFGNNNGIYGPFDSMQEAMNWAESHFGDRSDWFIAPLYKPGEAKD